MIELLGYYFLGVAIMSVILGFVWMQRRAANQADPDRTRDAALVGEREGGARPD